MTNDLKFILTVDTASGNASLKSIQTQMQQVGKSAQQMGSIGQKAVDMLGGSFKAALLSGIGFGSGLSAVKVGETLADWTKQAVVMGMQFNSLKEQSQIAFSTMLGSGAKAKAFLQDLQDFANVTPFEFPGLVKSAQRLLAFGFTAKQVKPMLQAVGDAASGLGMDSAGMDRITLALGQMQLKGRVMTQEMNQLTEVGINAWDMLATKMNISKTALVNLVEQGAVPAGKAVQDLLTSMNDQFGGMMEKQSKTMQGLMSTMADVGRVITGSLTQPLFELSERALGPTVAGMTALSSVLKLLQPEIDETSDGLGDLLDVSLKLADIWLKIPGNAAMFADGIKGIAGSASQITGINGLRQLGWFGGMVNSYFAPPLKPANAMASFDETAHANWNGNLYPARTGMEADQSAPKKKNSPLLQKRLDELHGDTKQFWKTQEFKYLNSDNSSNTELKEFEKHQASVVDSIKDWLEEEKRINQIWQDAGDDLIRRQQFWADKYRETQNRQNADGLTPTSQADVSDGLDRSRDQARLIIDGYKELKRVNDQFVANFRDGAGRVWDDFFSAGSTAMEKLANVAKALFGSIARTMFQNFATGLFTGAKGGGGGGIGGGIQSFGAAAGAKLGMKALFGGGGGIGMFAGGLPAVSGTALSAGSALGIGAAAPGMAFGGSLAGASTAAAGTIGTGAAGGLTGALGLGGGAGLLGMGAATIPVLGGIALGVWGLYKLWKHGQVKVIASKDPYDAMKDKTLWFNTTFPFEQMATTLARVNAGQDALNGTLSNLGTMDPGVLMVNGYPAVRQQVKDTVSDGLANDRDFRTSVGNGVNGTAT